MGGCTMKRIPWDLQEAAVLLQGLLDVQDGKISRTDAIAHISTVLRNRAARQHHDIDEKFRNENGISMQMAHLEYGLTEGKSGWKPTCRWQDKILDIYHNEPDTYKRLLHEARKQQEN